MSTYAWIAERRDNSPRVGDFKLKCAVQIMNINVSKLIYKVISSFGNAFAQRPGALRPTKVVLTLFAFANFIRH